MRVLNRRVYSVAIIICSVSVNAQTIELVAGDGSTLSGGDGGPALSAQVSYPASGCFDFVGNYYFGENVASPRIRVISPLGIIKTIAGTGSFGYSGDGGPATAAKITSPANDVDALGNVYIADYYNNRVRKVDATTGIISTIAGTGSATSTGDGGFAIAASLTPSDLEFDVTGNAYICDGAKIRMINASGIINTIAGNGIPGYSGDGGPATNAQITVAYGICFDAVGNLYIACNSGTRVRKINASTGIITTVAGNGVAAYTGDGIPATDAQIRAFDIVCDLSGNLYIADEFNDRIRKVDASTGLISTIAGNGAPGYSGDGGLAISAGINGPEGLTIDECGNLYLADHFNNRIRKLVFSATALPIISITPIPNDTVCSGNPVTYTTSTVGIGAPAYQWYVNGSPVSGTGSTFTYSPATGDTVYCKIIGTATCSGNTVTRFSNGIKMVVNPTTPASLTVTASPNDTVCTGTAVTCVASITGGGATPAYYWYVNGIPVSGTSAYTFTPVTGDSVSCVMVSSATCPVPDDTLESHLRLTVLPYVTPSVSITSSISSEGFTCAGDTVTFVATAVNGGATPGYQWKKNGVNVGTGSSSYIYSPADGDTVRCVLTSSEMCPTVPTAISNNVGPMAVMPIILPSISLTASPTVEIGETVTVNATVTGTSSYNIKWFKNTSLVATTSTPVFTYTKTAGIDFITAMVIHSGSGCFDSASSAAISIAAPNLVETLQQSSEFSVYPNPAHDELTISGAASINTVAVTNLLGQSYYKVTPRNRMNQLVINIGQLPAGVYVVRVNGIYFQRFVKQ
jgi:hypothetical protein